MDKNTTPMSDERYQELLRKVQALFALAGNNPERAEAEAAALKAQQIIAKYNLVMADAKEDKPEIAQVEYHTGIDKSFKYSLARVVADNFRCECWWLGKAYVVFLGYKPDAEVAKATFEFLFKTCEKGARRECRKAYKERGTETGVYFSYTRGFVVGIKEKLDAQCVALAVVTPQEVTTEFKAQTEGFKTLGKYRAGNEQFSKSHYVQGKRDGRAAMNSRAIEGGQ